MDKRAEFNMALKEAMKNKDQVALSTIRLMTAALKDRDITAKADGKADGISDSEILSMLQSMIKQRQDSALTYRDAGREELASREEQEIAVIQKFMPAQLDEAEIDTAINSAIESAEAHDIKDMGKVMGVLKSKYAGQMDMGKVSDRVKNKLA